MGGFRARWFAAGLGACLAGAAVGADRAAGAPSALAGPGATPVIRALAPVALQPTADGPTPDKPLSFGRRASSVEPATDRPTPSLAQGAPTGAGVSATQASAAAPPASAESAAAVPSGAAPAASANSTSRTATPPPAPGKAASPTRPTLNAAAAANDRAREAAALARLRSRLEQTLRQHSTVDARISVDRGAVQVAGRGVEPAKPVRISTAARPAGAAKQGKQAKQPNRPTGPVEWSYVGETGPAHWASLHPDWTACGAETPQSPIDIRDGIAVGLPAIGFDYPPAILTVRDDGHAIRAAVGVGPAIDAVGTRYELRDISFHQPAEFRVDGKAFDLSAHLLHRDERGRIAIVVVLFEIGDDAAPRNPLVQTVLDYLPLDPSMKMPVGHRVDLESLLPPTRGYFNFIGSLTTPPCSSGVVWIVMQEPIRLPPSQVAIFTRIHPDNVRPLQPLAGRLIKQSE